jgi:prevent-host-death family protein
MYIVHMKRYTVAQARQKLAEVLDRAEEGESVVIERRGVRFVVSAKVIARPTVRRAPLFELTDDAVEAGEWSWDLAEGRVAFKARAGKP